MKGGTGMGRNRLARFAAGALVYLALGMFWLYWVVDEGGFEGSDLGAWTILGLVLAVHVAFGWVIREWAALLLPIALVFVAIPAGYPESQYGEPGLVWMGQIFLVVLEIPAIAAGLGLRTLYGGVRRTPWPDS
jgi:hypothetical protein